MKDKEIEIEIKVRISDDSKLLDFLETKAKFVDEDYQKDEYFTPAHRDFRDARPIVEWFRIRGANDGVITYKKWHYDKDGKSYHCDEYESSISNIDQVRKILSVLDMKPVITLEKKRKKWLFEDYEIALDDVTDLGNFVEVEYKGATEDSPKVITSKMVEFLKDIGCGKIERNFVGYPFLLLYPDEAEFEEV